MDIEKINEIKAQMDYERTRNSHPEGFPKLPEIPGKRYTCLLYTSPSPRDS